MFPASGVMRSTRAEVTEAKPKRATTRAPRKTAAEAKADEPVVEDDARNGDRRDR